jgi:hypothetical protein
VKGSGNCGRVRSRSSRIIGETDLSAAALAPHGGSYSTP